MARPLEKPNSSPCIVNHHIPLQDDVATKQRRMSESSTGPDEVRPILSYPLGFNCLIVNKMHLQDVDLTIRRETQDFDSEYEEDSDGRMLDPKMIRQGPLPTSEDEDDEPSTDDSDKEGDSLATNLMPSQAKQLQGIKYKESGDRKDLDNTQRTATHKVEIKKASESYQIWKDLHDTTKARVDAIRTNNDIDDTAIMKELAGLSRKLHQYNLSVQAKKRDLDKLISQGEEEFVEIIVWNSPKRKRSRNDNKPPKLLYKRQKFYSLEAEESRSGDDGAGKQKRKTKSSSRCSGEHSDTDEEYSAGRGEKDKDKGLYEDQNEESGSEIDEDKDVGVKESTSQSKPTPAASGPATSSTPVLTPLPIDESSLYHISNVDLLCEFTPSYFHATAIPCYTSPLLHLLLGHACEPICHLPHINFLGHEILKNISPLESTYIRDFTSSLPSNQFDWGIALSGSVRDCICFWGYSMKSNEGKPLPEEMEPFVARMKHLCEDKEMEKHLKTAPRLMQLSSTDPYLTGDSLNWELVSESTRYPWTKRNGLFRALHAMSCRTDNKLQWSTESSIQIELKSAYPTLRKILQDSIELISYNTQHDNIIIETTGPHAIPPDCVAMSKTVGWVFQQIMIRGQAEEDVGQKKVHKHGIGWFQRRLLLVLTGVMLVYERTVYNAKLATFLTEKKRTRDEISSMKKYLKYASCINQFSHNWVFQHPERTIKNANLSTEELEEALDNVTGEDIKRTAIYEASYLQADALQALAMFLLYGTAGLFHVWTNHRDQMLHDASYAINLAAILSKRHANAVKNKERRPHSYYDRAWNHLDHHMFTTLSEFINDEGEFKKNIKWPRLTREFNTRFNAKTLSSLYTLDLQSELFNPGQTLAPDGTVAPPVAFHGLKNLPGLAPESAEFRKIWTQTEDKVDAEPQVDATMARKDKNKGKVPKVVSSPSIYLYLIKNISVPNPLVFAVIIPPPTTTFKPQFYFDLSSPILRILLSFCFLVVHVSSCEYQFLAFMTNLARFCPLALVQSSESLTSSMMETVMPFGCGKCALTFEKKSQADFHRRVAHQLVVQVTTYHGVQMDLKRGDSGFFSCPSSGCDYESDNTAYLVKHVLGCQLTGPRAPAVEEKHFPGKVVPPGVEVEFNDALAKYHLMWNTRACITICTQCNKGVPLSEVAGHRKRHNPLGTVHTKDVLEDLKEYVSKENPGKLPIGYVWGEPCDPIQGLKIYNGFSCLICQRALRAESTLYNHFYYHHRVPNSVPRTPSPEPLGYSEAIKKLMGQLEEHASQSHLVPDPQDDNQLSNWLYVSGIHDYINRHIRDGKSIVELMIPEEEDVFVQTMVPYIAYWINQIMRKLHKTGQLLKHQCLAETSELEDNKGIMPLQEKASVIKYSTTIARFMQFLMNEAKSPLDPNTQLYKVHIGLLANLSKAVSSAILVQPEDPDPEDKPLQHQPELFDPISKHVSRILCSIFQVYCSAADCQYWLPACQYLARSMLKVDGSYDAPDNFTRRIAHIQYGVRLAFAEEFLAEAAGREGFNPEADPTLPSKDDFTKFKFLHKGPSAPFNIMRQLMHLATTVHMSEGLPDATFWADHNQETLEINNKTVTISGIRSCIQLQDKMAEVDLHEIVKGCKLPPFDLSLYSDKPNNTSPGYNYLTQSQLFTKNITFTFSRNGLPKRMFMV
ncbi:uncharacterized protein MELLADRAFT_62518 [Melampsora larici-populina 98AG31]|uniref:C2H2-type domain-containing protein n=1 Tax=Melampsora larici-populina (strain 98AG31 / pathotype 3-4-7) TaxID=747676 RepID=F4RJ77_MELLP|nr:uncharacterized protein MELLADRAFT_62518 [Melampsora larici-populina 98AG31]EGG07551.1 hypothetical protein MELLADRAFT_62518 [Melampsora larici-populina 98AG31]